MMACLELTNGEAKPPPLYVSGGVGVERARMSIEVVVEI